MVTRRDVLTVLAGLGLTALGLGASGCAKKVPLTEAQKPYAGKWTAADGTFVHIYLDGGGDFKMSSSNVSGGNAKIEGSTLTIGLGPIDKAFKIDEAPKEAGGKWTMKLDGVTYTKN